MLRLNDVVKHYAVVDGEPVRAVDGVSMHVPAGELAAVYGPSGSGKTTLLKLIAALLQPDRGSIELDGRDISNLSSEEASSYRLHELGFIDQSFDLLDGARAIENASLKLWLTLGPGKSNAVIRPLLERLDLGKRLDHRPDQLSMGERQRVAIARALSTEPKLLLADEPTGSLDTQRGRETLELLVEVCQEREVSILLVTHDPQVASFSDQIYTLSDGKLVRSGREKLLTSFERRG